VPQFVGTALLSIDCAIQECKEADKGRNRDNENGRGRPLETTHRRAVAVRAFAEQPDFLAAHLPGYLTYRVKTSRRDIDVVTVRDATSFHVSQSVKKYKEVGSLRAELLNPHLLCGVVGSKRRQAIELRSHGGVRSIERIGVLGGDIYRQFTDCRVGVDQRPESRL
jgi:hypothetical protein